jgi:two-component system, sensor histidine kinase YesM
MEFNLPEGAVDLMDNFIEEFLGYMNLLNNLAMSENAKKTQDMVQKITGFLKYKFAQKDEIVTLKEELIYIDKLIDIFIRRFGQNLEFTRNIEDGTTDLYIPNYTLLALVENALFHGFIPKEGGWKLTLEVKNAEKDIQIKIIDNGIGFDTGKLESSKNPDGKYGSIPNVKSRLQNYFGNDNIVNISSTIDEGTRVYINIPIQEVIC